MYDPLRWRLNNGMVEIVGNITGGTDIAVFTLPPEFRPASEEHLQIEKSEGWDLLTVSPDGSVLVSPGAEWYRIDVSFPVADPESEID